MPMKVNLVKETKYQNVIYFFCIVILPELQHFIFASPLNFSVFEKYNLIRKLKALMIFEH